MNQLSVLLCFGILSAVGATETGATQNFAGAVLSETATFDNETLIRMFASPSSTANFTVPVVFPTDAEAGDVIQVSVDLEISNPNEGFDPRSGKAPRSDLSDAQLCSMSIILNNTIVWVGELLPTFSILQIDSNSSSFIWDEGLENINLSIQQKCPNPSSEFLVHGATLFIEVPVAMTDGSNTTTATESSLATVSTVTSSASITSIPTSSIISFLSIYGAFAACWLLANV
ncbi:hypothetical protein B0J13DRAFT_131951 [Dactylonectria estremocensis]|uniref:Uncharacterized protein n=1 Tax=Dactylonectria estremocensis TaxID=1079267 RepID=A0A9P9IP23_9HYPO|nr:hypothetical protein B0J13DRAFT_131951 [Dactylonectria estremocensis]